MRSFGWFILHAVEIHAILFIALPREGTLTTGSTRTTATVTSAPPQVEVDEEPPPPESSSPPVQTSAIQTRVVGPPLRPAKARVHAALGSPAPAAAASAVALPDVGDPLPVALATTYPGGLTSSDGTTNAYVDALLGGFGGTRRDLSAPARLGGVKTWGACRADGVPDLSFVRLRALVRADGTAVRLESAEPPGLVSNTVLSGAMPCAMREHYVPGRDREGRPAERWTLPFRVEVLGLLK